MEKRKFKVGDKVKIPKTKSVGININDLSMQALLKEEKYNYLIVKNIIRLNAFEQRIECMFPTSKICTDFLNTDLEHYEEFPEKWAIELYPEVKKWIKKEYRTNYYSGDPQDYIFHFPNYKNMNGFLKANHMDSKVEKGYTLITLEQFKKYILKEMERKIIGYKLIKPEYRQAALGLIPTSVYLSSPKLISKEGNNYLDSTCPTINNLRKAGVLDLWFEPVYEEKKQIIKMHSSNKGEFEIEIIDGKAYYRPENKELPKEWVRDIINSYGNILIQKNVINPYNVEISSINVGCYHNCKKEDWENVYKLLK